MENQTQFVYQPAPPPPVNPSYYRDFSEYYSTDKITQNCHKCLEYHYHHHRECHLNDRECDEHVCCIIV